jgi:hypothetical protein
MSTASQRRQARAAERRARDRARRYMGYIATVQDVGRDGHEWLAAHIGRLVQRVDELQARVSRIEGRAGKHRAAKCRTVPQLACIRARLCVE